MSPRRSEQVFAWFPPNRATIWSVTIDGEDVTNFVLDGKFPRGLLTEELVCEVLLDNSAEEFTDRFSQGNVIIFKMDFSTGTKIQFEGEVEEIKNKLQILPVSKMDDVLKIALERMPDPIEWDEDQAAEAAAVSKEKDATSGVTAH